MAFPEHYVVLPADRNKEIGLDPGFFCGERSTIKDLWQQYEKDPKAPLILFPVFFMSAGVGILHKKIQRLFPFQIKKFALC
jgi:hypothetical protein